MMFAASQSPRPLAAPTVRILALVWGANSLAPRRWSACRWFMGQPGVYLCLPASAVAEVIREGRSIQR